MLAVLPNGGLASGSRVQTVRIWNVYSGQTEMILTGHPFEVSSLELLPNGDLMSGLEYIRIWDLKSGQM